MSTDGGDEQTQAVALAALEATAKAGLELATKPKRNKGRRRGDRTTPRAALDLYWPDRVARA